MNRDRTKASSCRITRAGCSLAESITAADVRALLKAQYPGVPVVDLCEYERPP